MDRCTVKGCCNLCGNGDKLFCSICRKNWRECLGKNNLKNIQLSETETKLALNRFQHNGYVKSKNEVGNNVNEGRGEH